MRILFSGVGSSDPVRGEHDGGLMHIMRKYRPDVVLIFITKEFVERDREDQRFEKMKTFIESHWEGYHFTLERKETGIEDPSDLDGISQVILETAAEFQNKYPGAELLLNLSSGTPQMKMVFSMIALEAGYHSRGIQVKNYERASGSSERTNVKDYDVELELEFNEDEKPGAPDRCVEPRLFYLQKQKDIEQIRALLKEYDYEAVSKMTKALPPHLLALVRHLNLRQKLLAAEAQKAGQEVRQKNPGLFPLYPKNSVNPRKARDFAEVSEFALLLRNLQISGNYTEFVLRMNPFVVRLQTAYLEKLRGYRIQDICNVVRGKGLKWSPEKFSVRDPALYRAVTENHGSIEPNFISIVMLYNVLLSVPDTDAEIMKLFEICKKLNEGRNDSAHQLHSITDGEIRELSGMDSRGLRLQFENAILKIYDGANPKLFDIYDRCNAYILDSLSSLSS